MSATPMVNQPGGGVSWMTAPSASPDCPAGLEYLLEVDQLLVKQQVEMLEAFTGFETNNKYKILNSMGQQVYFAAEDTSCCARLCFKQQRPFTLRILDNQADEVLTLHRPIRCSSCWFPCCLQEVEVMDKTGQTIGWVKQAWSVCKPKYYIQTAQGDTVLTIDGQCCTCSCMGDVVFTVKAKEVEVGQITKQWTGLTKEVFTDADNFGVTFPKDLDVKVKATLLGAVFLIDFMYFESDSKDDNVH